MSLPKTALLALCLILAGAIVVGSSSAQQQDKPVDLKPLMPPALPPLPPNSQWTSGSVSSTPVPGTANTPSTQAPPTQSAPGLRFSIPAR